MLVLGWAFWPHDVLISSLCKFFFGLLEKVYNIFNYVYMWYICHGFLNLGSCKSCRFKKREREKLIVIAGLFNRMVHKNGDWSRKRWLKNSIRRVSKLVVFPDLGLLGSRPVSDQTDLKFRELKCFRVCWIWV